MEGLKRFRLLARSLKASRIPHIRLVAIQALGEADSDEAVELLLEVAQTEASMDERTTAITALGRIGTPAAQDALLQVLQGGIGSGDPEENNNPEDDG